MRFHDYSDDALTNQLLIHGIGTKVVLEQSGVVGQTNSGSALVQNRVENVLFTPEQLAAIRAARVAAAAAARRKRIQAYIDRYCAMPPWALRREQDNWTVELAACAKAAPPSSDTPDTTADDSGGVIMCSPALRSRGLCGFDGFASADLIYTVQPGDTLTGIALAHGRCQKGPGNTAADWEMCVGAARNIAIASGIDLNNMDNISVGQQLVIPGVDVAVRETPDGPVAVAVVQKTPSAVLWLGAGLAAVMLWKALRG